MLRPAEIHPPAEVVGGLPRYAYMARFGDAGFGPNLASYFDRAGRLAYVQPENFWAITAAVAVEQFGYGFGFTAYLLYCVYVASGDYETVHYALCTGCMALGMMIPGMWSGWLQELIGYEHFFIWIMLAAIPSFLSVVFIPLDPQFGKKAESENARKDAA